ncbi:hypothetical protein EV182_001577 [Spiromyces aspiralis]|uniref:Uncharacterized protein n=1 Tax=Spiromyces aspiralis TaxID=68401 RepID=A0ACC1HZ16_9FUNG|nr:hypothetical protein EV182_001577 [Spiromyces aspiralis]
MINTPPRAPTPADYDKLADKFEKLALQVKELQTNSTKVATTSKPCMYCDRQGHTKRQCELPMQDLRAKIVHINQFGKLTNLSSEAYCLNTGNGGIRALITTATTKLVRSEPIQLMTNATTATIHWEEAPAAATHDNDTYTNEFDVNVVEKILSQTTPLSLKELISLAITVHKSLHESTGTHRVSVEDLNLMTAAVYKQLAERGRIVLQGGEYEVLLGQPWQRLARLKSGNRPDGNLWCSVQDAETDQEVTFCAVPTVNKKAYQANGDLPRINQVEHTVGRVTAEIDLIGAFRGNELLEDTISACARSEKSRVRLAAAAPVRAPCPNLPKTIEDTLEQRSMKEVMLAAVQASNSGLSEPEGTYIGGQHRQVAEGPAAKPTGIGTRSATINKPDKLNTIPCETWKERLYLCPRAQENELPTLSGKKRSERRTIAENCIPPSGLLPRGSNESPLRQAIDTDEEKKGATQECYKRGGERREKIREKNKVTFGNSRRVHKAPLEIGDLTPEHMIMITIQEEQVITNRWAAPYEIAEAHSSGSDSFADLVRIQSQSPIAGYRLKDVFIRASASPDSSSAGEDVMGIGSTVVPQGDCSSAEGQ